MIQSRAASGVEIPWQESFEPIGGGGFGQFGQKRLIALSTFQKSAAE
jgi:hypothetical protein